MTRNDDLIVHLARFAGALRARGVEVGVGDEVDATKALTLVDLSDRAEIHRGLRVALKIRPRDGAVFDDVFGRYWSGGGADLARRDSRADPAVSGAVPGHRPYGDRAADSGERESHITGGTPSYSPDIVLRRKPFEECSARDLADMERLLTRLAPRWPARRSRRLMPVRGRGIPDLRRSLRRAIATGGELLSLARRDRAPDEPHLVVLCDTSGSMDVHVRFLLAFVMALKRVARRTEVFAFNTSLVRVTPWLAPGKIGPTLERLAAAVPGWSGGTRIGESLTEFVAKYRGELVTGRSVIVILSDGLDRGDTALVTGAMRALHSAARRIVWLNPLSGDPRYEPTARAMQAALPFIDRLGPAHNLESLERLLPELAA